MASHRMHHARLRPDDRTQSWATGSLWAAAPDHRTYRAPVDGEDVDVAVIGAGIAGLLTATLLTRAGSSVRVLDRHEVGGVATRNTTAKVSALQGTQYQAIRAAAGPRAAAAYGAAQLDAVAALGRLIADLDLDCARTDAPAYTYASDPAAEARARAELDAARAAGLDVHWVTDTELPFPIIGAVRLDGQLHVHPGRLCAALAAALPTGTIAEHTTVTGIAEHGDGCTVTTEDGATLRAGHVVQATQAPIADPALLANRCTPQQSYCLAARTSGPVPEGMYLSCDESTRSMRPAIIDGATVLVVGGAGHQMGDPAATPERWDELAAWATDRFGRLEVTHRWATHDLVPTDHVPFIGRLHPGAHRRWVATGFAKWGMTNAYVAARLLTAGIHGDTIDWADTFDATRVRRSLNRHMVAVGANATTHLLLDRIARRPEPRCTHQGCVMREDTALGTWDCPCHGSRFAADGAVIQGPATAPANVN